jgi:hypothetical protein
MGNIYFQKIQISGPAMNFVLEPQNFSGKNWNSPINTGRRSPTTSIPSRYMRQVMQRYPVPPATEIQFQGSNDGVNCALFDYHHRRFGRRGYHQHQQQPHHRQLPAAPFRHSKSGRTDQRSAGAVECFDDRAERRMTLPHASERQ